MTKQRIKNYAMWTALTSQVLIVLQLLGHITGLFDITEALKSNIILLVDGILVIFSTLGIISNPTKPDSKGFNL